MVDWEAVKRDIAAFKKAIGPTCRIVSKPGKSLVIAWDEVKGWKAEHYQVMGRSIPLHGDKPVIDDPFVWEQDENGKWHRRPRLTWTALGGYDLAYGPYRGACSSYSIVKKWLETSGPGPWQIVVAAYWKDRGWVYGPLVEWDDVKVKEPTRMDKIVSAIQTYTGRRTKDGRPWVRYLRKHADMPDITTKERDEAYKKAN